jgi:hypothetical protein
MQPINNLNQIKGGFATALKTKSNSEQLEIIRLFEEDRNAFLLLHGEKNSNIIVYAEREEHMWP